MAINQKFSSIDVTTPGAELYPPKGSDYNPNIKEIDELSFPHCEPSEYLREPEFEDQAKEQGICAKTVQDLDKKPYSREYVSSDDDRGGGKTQESKVHPWKPQGRR